MFAITQIYTIARIILEHTKQSLDYYQPLFYYLFLMKNLGFLTNIMAQWKQFPNSVPIKKYFPQMMSGLTKIWWQRLNVA